MYLNTRKANKDADQAQKTAVDNQKPAFSDVRKGLFAYRIAQAGIDKQNFKTKMLEKKYTTSISLKNTTNFVLTTFLYNDFCFLTALLIAVNFNFSDAPRAQDNLSKLLSALSAIAAPSAGTLQNLCTILGREPALGAAMVESVLSNFDRLS